VEATYLLNESQHSVVNLLSVMYGMNNIKFCLPTNSYVCMEHLYFGGTDVRHGIVGPYENMPLTVNERHQQMTFSVHFP